VNNPYDLHSWSKRYREEALREARVRDLIRPPLVEHAFAARQDGARRVVGDVKHIKCKEKRCESADRGDRFNGLG
jgi:hypothetical protein